MQALMRTYLAEVKFYASDLIGDTYNPKSDLNSVMRDSILRLRELQSDGTITTYNTTFHIGIM